MDEFEIILIIPIIGIIIGFVCCYSIIKRGLKPEEIDGDINDFKTDISPNKKNIKDGNDLLKYVRRKSFYIFLSYFFIRHFVFLFNFRTKNFL